MTPPYNNLLTIPVSVPSGTSYSDRVQASKVRAARHISSLRRSIICQKQKITSLEPVVTSLLAASRRDPAHSAYLLQSYSRDVSPNIAVIKPVGKAICGVRATSGGGRDCRQITLPFSKFCLQRKCMCV